MKLTMDEEGIYFSKLLLNETSILRDSTEPSCIPGTREVCFINPSINLTEEQVERILIGFKNKEEKVILITPTQREYHERSVKNQPRKTADRAIHTILQREIIRFKRTSLSNTGIIRIIFNLVPVIDKEKIRKVSRRPFVFKTLSEGGYATGGTYELIRLDVSITVTSRRDPLSYDDYYSTYPKMFRRVK